MALITKAGTYIARPKSWALGETREKKCPQFTVQFKCEQYRNGSGFEPVQGDESITGYFTLINGNNEPNEINLRSLHDALGWDGRDFSSLESSDWTNTEVQIVVEDDTYNGKPSLRVRYLNPKDYSGGGLEKADPQAVKSLDQKYGPALRALFGTKPTPKQVSAAAAPVASPDTPDGAKQLAWEAFNKATPSYDPGKRVQVFKKVVGEVHPTTEPKSLTADQWKQVREAIESDFNEATEGLIPF